MEKYIKVKFTIDLNRLIYVAFLPFYFSLLQRVIRWISHSLTPHLFRLCPAYVLGMSRHEATSSIRPPRDPAAVLRSVAPFLRELGPDRGDDPGAVLSVNLSDRQRDRRLGRMADR